jgi:hypothetical protein
MLSRGKFGELHPTKRKEGRSQKFQREERRTDQLTGAVTSWLPVSFRLPENHSPTRLADSPPVYWEIEARGRGAGADYQAYFLVPVYKNT